MEENKLLRRDNPTEIAFKANVDKILFFYTHGLIEPETGNRYYPKTDRMFCDEMRKMGFKFKQETMEAMIRDDQWGDQREQTNQLLLANAQKEMELSDIQFYARASNKLFRVVDRSINRLIKSSDDLDLQDEGIDKDKRAKIQSESMKKVAETMALLVNKGKTPINSVRIDNFNVGQQNIAQQQLLSIEEITQMDEDFVDATQITYEEHVGNIEDD